MDILRKLCDIDSASGEEEYVRHYIESQIKKYCDYYVDRIGNLIAFKKGKKQPEKMICYTAHMDEVGFMVKKICDDGTIKVDSMGVSPNVCGGKTIKIRSTVDPKNPKWVYGVFGMVPVHALKGDEFNLVPSFNDLRLDIGTTKKEETEALVELGDYAYFENNFGALGNLIKSKALDDRVGCRILINMIQSDLEYDSCFVFTVQEEIGSKGAAAAAFSLKPWLTICIEGTATADIAGVKETEKVCSLGKGAVIFFMDRYTIYDPVLVNRLTSLADKENIPWQYKSYVAGGNDSDEFQRKAGGGKVLTVAVPVRYIHSQRAAMNPEDMNNTFKLCQSIDRNLDIFLKEE